MELREVVARAVCKFKGHAYSPKTVVKGEFVSGVMATCDRCGKGEDDLNLFKAIAEQMQFPTSTPSASDGGGDGQ